MNESPLESAFNTIYLLEEGGRKRTPHVAESRSCASERRRARGRGEEGGWELGRVGGWEGGWTEGDSKK